MHSWEDSDIATYSQNYSCSFSPFSFPFQYSYRDLSRGIVVRAIAPEKKVKLSFCILLCLGITQEHMCYIMIQCILHHRSRWKSECLETLSKGASMVPRDHSTKKITIEMGRKKIASRISATISGWQELWTFAMLFCHVSIVMDHALSDQLAFSWTLGLPEHSSFPLNFLQSSSNASSSKT